ncbi:MAG: Clp protease N-terminal domain-containing protein [Planctomycetota bacterium]
MPMQHFDADAKAIVKVANEIAHEHELEYVGTEHVLLAILRHNAGLGSRILEKLGVTEQRARQAIDKIVQRSMEDTWVFGRLPGSPNYRRVVELAIEEARKLDAKLIGSEHLLLGLLREKGTTGQQALAGLGVTIKKCREQIIQQRDE